MLLHRFLQLSVVTEPQPGLTAYKRQV